MLDGLLQNVTPRDLLLVLVGVLLSIYITNLVTTELKIRRLGGHAPVLKTYLPFGADFVYRALKYGARNQQLMMWGRAFRKWGNKANPRTLEVNGGGRRVILTIDSDNIKAILATQFNDYGKGPRFNKDWYPFLGDSIFSTDHQKWHDSRQLIRPQFIKDRVSDLETFESHVQPLIELMGGKGQVVDVRDLFFRFTLDAVTDFLLGSSVDSLHKPQVHFAHAFAEIQRMQSDFARAGPMNRFMPRAKYMEHIRSLNEFVEPFIEKTLDLSPTELEERTKTSEGYTFLHAIASYTRERAVLRDQLVAVLLAGRDTTACTLSWLFYELGRAPAIVKELRQEIEETVGLRRKPTYADLKTMKRLSHVISETLRLYPVVPYNVRVALKDTSLPSGGGPSGRAPIGVPEGTPVAYSTHRLQLDDSIYPPTSATFSDPALFDPHRWEEWHPKAWTYIPFNGGPRLCAGQQFALTEMGYTVVRILQKFSRIESRQNEDGGLAGGFETGGAVGEKGRDEWWKDMDLWERMTSGRIGMKSEIVLQPADEVRLAFYE